jgi:hypothetical protein
MRRTKEQLKRLVELVRQANTEGWVCDSVQGCDSWQNSYQQIEDGLNFFEYQTDYNKYRGDRFKVCPWCGKELNWNWKRLNE